ncbi:MAG: TonB-dependent receptor [Alphaproteobacteria bacterium]|nr:TonB-dependent receptor [Alphaproteobacteria bacterium]
MLFSAAATFLSSAAHGEDIETVVVTAQTLPLDKVGQIDKTGTPMAEVPRSIQVVPESLFNEQGATTLQQVLPDVSGATQGGQFNFGFFDRFVIRGLNVSFLNDGLPEGTSDLTGMVHTLTGVERVEVLKGPGSALYGSSEEGGTINLVHFRPRDTFGFWASTQFGSYDATTTDIAVTGPTGIAGLNMRLDGSFQHTDGFRDLNSQTGEVLGALDWQLADHEVQLRAEYHDLQNLPDASGIPFSPPNGVGEPLDVPSEFTYYTPFAFADQRIERVFLTDAWKANEALLVNLRASYSQRDVDLARNAGGSVTKVGDDYQLTRRQLRAQTDDVRDWLFQAEPTWRFDTGGLKHTLVSGAEARIVDAGTLRATADLPSIADIFHPVVIDGSLSSLVFKCDAGHSCADAKLSAEFYGLYLIDQVNVTDALKLRFSVRKDWFETEAAARRLLPVNGGQEEPCDPPQAVQCPLVPGHPMQRHDEPVSWDAGAVYFLTPKFSVFGGYSTAAYPVFNTEEPASVGQTPERGTQGEVGLRLQQDWLTASTSGYRVTRDNVFTVVTEADPNGGGNIVVPGVFSYRVQGWETDLNLRPMEGLSVVANLAVQSAVITRYPQTPANVGKAVPSVPSLLGNVWASYDLPVSVWDRQPTLSFGMQYRNHEYGDAANTRVLPGDPVFNLALSVPYREWRFQAGLSNLFDRRYFVDATGTGGGASPGAGRTFFVKLSYGTE